MNDIREKGCPSCKYKIGEPLDEKGNVSMPSKNQPGFCFCIRCLAPIMLEAEKEPRLITYKELYSMCLMRPNEILNAMYLALHLNKNLPLINSASN